MDVTEWIACELYMTREKLAAQFGQVATGASWRELPESVRRLQIAVVAEAIQRGTVDVNHWMS